MRSQVSTTRRQFLLTYHIPPTMLCRRAETGESASDDSSGDIVIYEEMLEAGLRFPIPHSVCDVLNYFSLTPGQLAPNGWKLLLAFLEPWRRVHHDDASPTEFHVAYYPSETPATNRGWFYFTPMGGKLITGLSSNCHSWKSHFFFVGGEWASDLNRALVPSRWIAPKKIGMPRILTPLLTHSL